MVTQTKFKEILDSATIVRLAEWYKLWRFAATRITGKGLWSHSIRAKADRGQ